ncbi:unnamed protein product [Blepharisma stoltei]|uniref:NADH dehydrogenase [ubiquinone] 1 alpha subcomplex subunit 12 n=1 Tax=Blepharisma stoltei TaxID=1481888 RepID=A0AAU9J0U0_9CILI|nr:unnamed protein product [Blepharisma stoltei]
MIKGVKRIFKRCKAFIQDSRLKRIEIGTDMHGNIYYQHYDDLDFPTKREVEYKGDWRDAIMDPVWSRWLNGYDIQPPSKDEIENSYQSYLNRKKIGEEWDKKDELLMQNYREAMKKISSIRNDNKEFVPEVWTPPQLNKNKKY